jgi:hypothetical protein
MTREELEARAQEVWEGDEVALRLCEKIFAVLSERANSAAMLTFGDLSEGRMKGPDAYGAKVLAVTKYFTGDDAPLLVPHFLFIDDEHTEETPPGPSYSLSDVTRFEKQGFYHPDTGELVADAADKLYMYFEPSELAKAVFKGPGR